jgi:hypothetical protein
MTSQINDIFIYKDVKYALAGISEGSLFEPAMFKINPIAASTACWRGYVATFDISDSHLVLDSLAVNLHESDGEDVFTNGPSINGISPVAPTDAFIMFNNLYLSLNHRIDYTGGLLLGNEFIQELYVHMGFHPAWKYKNVIELIFEDGRLVNEYDRSEKMAQLRHTIEEDSNKKEQSKRPTDEEIEEFVERAFDRTYTQGS